MLLFPIGLLPGGIRCYVSNIWKDTFVLKLPVLSREFLILNCTEMVYNSIIDSIGNTPVVRLRSGISGKVVVYAKLEGQNPGGSVKDRVAVAMIEGAE